MRLFINLGSKDGIDPGGLVRFLTEMTDMDPQTVSRVTVRELSSFFNVPAEAVEFLSESLASRRFKSRKVRIEEADKKPAFKSREFGGQKDSYRKGNYERKDYGNDTPKFTRARKPQHKAG